MTASDVLPPVDAPPRVTQEAAAALLTVTGCVLLGAPLGLLWAAVSPRVEVIVAAGGDVSLADPTTSQFVAADGWFLVLAAAAGLLTGGLAWLAGRRYGFGVVIGLVVGGLLAAEVARRTGQLVDAGVAQSAARAGTEGVVELSVRLRSEQARVGWPVAALAAHMVLTLFDGSRHRLATSSG